MDTTTPNSRSTSNEKNEPALIGRRSLMRNSVLGAAGLAFGGLIGRTASAASLPFSPDYGPLMPAMDESTGLYLISLPEGFRYKTFGWTGDLMADGTQTPSAHDGMGVVAAKGNTVTMIRNHEKRGQGAAWSRLAYDSTAIGGTTNLTFDTYRGEWGESFASLSGTSTNCAGGLTPWGSWLTCEETTAGPETNDAAKTHGWIFEVPAYGRASAEPLKAMGRFVHEAVAVDPATGIVYETEDRGTSGFYRFIPNDYGKLQNGGKLQMLRVLEGDNVNLSAGYANDTTWTVDWVDIEDPERAHEPGTTNSLGVFKQGWAQGGARLSRGEGCWYDGGYIYFVSTSGGSAGEGQIFEYEPRSEKLRLVFESPSAAVLNSPDNIAVSPRGGIILCEDGSRPKQMLHGLTRDGQIFPFAENNVVLNGEKNGFIGNYTGREWCGATFYNQWLFVNIQTPGITFAITGPWDNGSL
ncbi:MAG: phosphatase [Alteromonadaceae bacterium]|nr:phosphatase [Alteromonadaceae bacterium]